LKHFMLTSWNGDGATGIRIDRQLRSKSRLTRSKSGGITADVAFVPHCRHWPTSGVESAAGANALLLTRMPVITPPPIALPAPRRGFRRRRVFRIS
jgi:hypothetical protein